VSEKEVTKEKMLILLDRLPQLVAAVYEGHWGNQEQLTYMAIRRLIENMDKKVSKKQLSIWADRIMSEVEIVGYVPEWILRGIFETLGHEIERED
jgi:hypothetical protein